MNSTAFATTKLEKCEGRPRAGPHIFSLHPLVGNAIFEFSTGKLGKRIQPAGTVVRALPVGVCSDGSNEVSGDGEPQNG